MTHLEIAEFFLEVHSDHEYNKDMHSLHTR